MAAQIQLPADATPEERLAAVQQELANIGETVSKLCEDIRDAASKGDVDEVKTLLTDFIKAADKKYVSRERFKLVERIVYGAVGGVLVYFGRRLLEHLF